MRRHLRAVFIIVVSVSLFLTLTAAAQAHSVNKQFGDFYGGMLHPVTALEHLLPILGLGLLAGQQSASNARWVLLLFPAGLLLGAALGGNLGPSPYIEWFNRFSFLAIGVLVAGAVRLPPVALALAAVTFGISHGYENVADISSTVAMHLFVPGVVFTGLAMIAIFAAFTVSREAPWQKMVVRVLGSWIAAVGILVAGLQ